MAITQVGSTATGPTSGSTSTTLTLNKPTGTASGDILVAVVAGIGSGAGGAITGPSGWTLIDSGESAGSFYTGLYAKIAGGSEPSSYSWTDGSIGSQRYVGSLSTFTGVDTSSLANAINTASEHSATANQTTTQNQTTPSLTTVRTIGRVFYARGARRGNATPITLSESSGTASQLSSTSNTTSSISYSLFVGWDDADFSGSGSKSGLTVNGTAAPTDNVLMTWTLKAAGVPATGDMDCTLPSVTSQFDGSRVMPDGPISMQLPSVTSQFDGIAAPPSGPMDATLPSVTSSMSGITDGAATMSAQLPSVTSQFTAGVEPLGTMSATLPSVTAAITAETTPFGEQVIHVEAETRAFFVIDDDPGLIEVRSRDQINTA